MPGQATIEITVEADTEEEARLKIRRRLAEMKRGCGRRCSFFDEYCGMMNEQEARDCFLGWGRLPMADGYCPIIHGSN